MAEHAFPFRQVRRRWRQPSEHRRERQRAIKHSAILRERSEQSDPGSRAAVLRRREGTCFSSPSDDEVGGLAMFAPPISQQRARAQRAPAPAASCVQEEMAEQRFSVPPGPTKMAATRRTSPRAAASNQTQRDPQRAARAIRLRIARPLSWTSEGADTFFSSANE